MRINVGKLIRSMLILAIMIGLIGLLVRNFGSIQKNIYDFFVPINVQASHNNEDKNPEQENIEKEIKNVEEKKEEPPMVFVGEPEASENTKPSNFNMKYEVQKYSESAVLPEYTLNLGNSKKYTKLKGVTTFRGNNYRDTASYGTLDIEDEEIERVWGKDIGAINTWSGVGWTGQPSIVQWDDDVKKDMNIFSKFKSKENFTEVIYGTLDSHIYFFDLETGEKSREPLKVNSCIKGSVTIDPRGYPLLYVGQGIDSDERGRVEIGYYIFSLITGEKLFFLNGMDSFAYRKWGAFDGNPVIDAETDSIILPGENGVIYIGRLNTNYDKENGTISVKPELNRYRYTTSKNNSMLGTENSMTVFQHYAYFCDNAGILQCLDLNTYTPVWINPMGDDCDSTIGLEEENGKVYLYIGTEVDQQAKNGTAYIRKIDGFNGEIVWEKSYKCFYDKDVNGGVLSSPIVGKNEIKDLVIFNIAKTGENAWRGRMVALYKSTGDVAWDITLSNYSWSSPVAVYTIKDKAYVVFCDSQGNVMLIDGRTGDICYTLETKCGNIEGSPAVFNDRIVIGTRGRQILGLKIK